jgi:outer membrane cobalamin receptor
MKLPADIYLNANFSVVSSQVFYEGTEKMRLDPYTVLDMKISKRIGPSVSLYLTIHNLFDANYYESEGYPREGRMISGGIQYDLQD